MPSGIYRRPNAQAIQDGSTSAPRFYVPPWGLTPQPATNTKNVNTSGYEASPAPDYYIFLTTPSSDTNNNTANVNTNAHDTTNDGHNGHTHGNTSNSNDAHGNDNGNTNTNSYQAFRTEFLKLTGPTPLLPDYAFGTW